MATMGPPGSPPPDDSAISLLNQQHPTESNTDQAWNSQGAPRRLRRIGASRFGSLYLRRRFLIGMALLLITFLAVLEILNYLSNRDQGFVAAPEGMHYLWRYGPAAGAYHRTLAVKGILTMSNT